MSMGVPSAGSSVLAVMGLTWKRLIRSRTIWVAGGIAMLPVVFAAVLQSVSRGSGGAAGTLIIPEQALLALIPGLLIASSIGEEIEDRTSTYLWSRPIARWAILLGKLATLVPVVVALSVANWCLALQIGTGALPSLGVAAAMAGGAAAASMVATGIATLAPRHGMGLTVAYLWFFDLGVGALPLSLRNLSISFQQRALIDALERPPPIPGQLGLAPPALAAPTATAAAIALLVLGGAWFVIAVWRFRRREA